MESHFVFDNLDEWKDLVLGKSRNIWQIHEIYLTLKYCKCSPSSARNSNSINHANYVVGWGVSRHLKYQYSQYYHHIRLFIRVKQNLSMSSISDKSFFHAHLFRKWEETVNSWKGCSILRTQYYWRERIQGN